jgi:nitroreductase
MASDRHLFTTMTPDSSDPDIVSIFDQLARCRRSIRGFLPTPVEQETLEQVFQTAAFAPSNCNTQPWYSYVVSGEMRDKLSHIFMETIGQGNYSLDFPYDAKYDGIYRQRQLDVGLLLYKALGVTREDKEGKRQAFLRNLEFFDAPHVVFIFMQEWCGIREACDVGMYAQNLMLTMRSHGIASCPQTILGYDADSVRRELGIDAEMKLLFGISFGYEDQSLPENQIVPDRATLDEHVKFYR